MTAISARLVRCSQVRSGGFLRVAHIACRLRVPALVMVRARTLSSALIVEAMIWNASRQITACGAR